MNPSNDTTRRVPTNLSSSTPIANEASSPSPSTNTNTITNTLSYPGPTKTMPNIVVFGETGTGKSSLINMLADDEVARTSSAAVGETFSSQDYIVTIDGTPYRLWDTAGMNEGAKGTLPAEKALENLRRLVVGLQDSDGAGGGVSMLLYCIRAGRYRDILRVNYDMFHGIICQSKVPIVLVVTGLEHESPMDAWWKANGDEFRGYGVEFKDEDVACVTTSKGKQMKDGTCMFEEEYEDSKGVVRELIGRRCPEEALSLKSELWIKQIGERMERYMEEFNLRTGKERKALQEDFAGRKDLAKAGRGWFGGILGSGSGSQQAQQSRRGERAPPVPSRRLEEAPRQADGQLPQFLNSLNGLLSVGGYKIVKSTEGREQADTHRLHQ